MSGVCHQLPERSLASAGQAWPLCARCTGMFVGMVAGLLFPWIARQGRRLGMPPLRILCLLGGLVCLWVLDGVNSWVALVWGRGLLYEPSNALRLATGMGAGLAFGTILYPIYQYATWTRTRHQRVLPSVSHFLGLVAVGATLVALLLVGRALPAAFWTVVLALAVLTTLGTANAVLVVLLTHKEGYAHEWVETVPYLLGGLLLALVEIGGMALLRRLLAG